MKRSKLLKARDVRAWAIISDAVSLYGLKSLGAVDAPREMVVRVQILNMLEKVIATHGPSRARRLVRKSAATAFACGGARHRSDHLKSATRWILQEITEIEIGRRQSGGGKLCAKK